MFFVFSITMGLLATGVLLLTIVTQASLTAFETLLLGLLLVGITLLTGWLIALNSLERRYDDRQRRAGLAGLRRVRYLHEGLELLDEGIEDRIAMVESRGDMHASLKDLVMEYLHHFRDLAAFLRANIVAAEEDWCDLLSPAAQKVKELEDRRRLAIRLEESMQSGDADRELIQSELSALHKQILEELPGLSADERRAVLPPPSLKELRGVTPHRGPEPRVVVERLREAERRGMPFVGLSWFCSNLLAPYDRVAAFRSVNQAIREGLIERYAVPNPQRPSFPTAAIRVPKTVVDREQAV